MVELKSISKYFPSNGVMALTGASITLRPGEIHALLGENGSGKSTLMHVLAGYFLPTDGSILIAGKPRRFSAPGDALACGIGMVRQHPALIGGFKVWEDCILGAERQKEGTFLSGISPFYSPRLLKSKVREVSEGRGFNLPLESPTQSLTISERQKAAVLSLLLRGVKWLIFDEPTSVLTTEEKENFFKLLADLRKEGRGIFLITHKLEEALHLSDRITVIRGGIIEKTFDSKEASLEVLEKAIFQGSDTIYSTKMTPSGSTISSINKKPVLSVNDLMIKLPGATELNKISFNIPCGEILGITGVRDLGLEALELALCGLLSPARDLTMQGSISLNGYEILGKGVLAFRRAGGAYLGPDRLGVNLASGLPLRESLLIHAFRRLKRGIFLKAGPLTEFCRRIMDGAGIDRSPSAPVDSFSGGMLQRILLAREFAEEASLLILSEGGSGLDYSKRLELEQRLREIAGQEKAVLLISTDVHELITVADRILVLEEGGLKG
ncbi:MAG: ATP-binding cassette domain-containing protein [Treponema sp.]|nr:ATP-binding cassette domain-containing protein [Treponema sp.]